MNRILLIGRLCRNPSLSYKDETAICKFYLAVDKPYDANRTEVTADFLPCVFFGKRAEAVAKYFRKGDKIALQGRIETSTYLKDDEKRSSFSIIASEFEFCESKKKDTDVTEQGFVPDESDEDLPF